MTPSSTDPYVMTMGIVLSSGAWSQGGGEFQNDPTPGHTKH